jgi:hypothetical protein
MGIGLTPDRFGRDPHATFLKILQDAGEPLTARKVIDAVAEHGTPRPTVSAAWATFQKTVVKFHPHIHLPGRGLYEWRAEPVAPDAALSRLVDLLATANKVKVPLRDALAGVVRAALATGGGDGDSEDARVRAARERQFKLDPLHAVAELAGEVEELAYDTGDAELIVERLRARVRAAALEQFGRPGDGTTFDPGRHDVMGERPADGAAVTVLRPGYASQENGTPLVLRKALVVAE